MVTTSEDLRASEELRTLPRVASDLLPERLRAGAEAYAAGVRGALGSRVLSVRLFGSWARGTARQDSDVDIWVLVDSSDATTRRVPYDVAVEVLLQHGIDIAPTVMDHQEWSFLRGRERRIARDIETEGVPL